MAAQVGRVELDVERMVIAVLALEGLESRAEGPLSAEDRAEALCKFYGGLA